MSRQTITSAKWLIPVVRLIFFTSLLLFFTNYAVATSDWRKLAPGIDYQDLDGNFLTPWSHLHVFRINLKENQLSLVTAADLSRKYASVDEYAQHTQALLAINGGFFDDNYKPLGLRIYNKRQKTPLKKISWWGIFYIKNQRAYLTNINQFNTSSQIDFAIQSGPRLLINDRIPPLKPGRAERSALGITRDGRVIILVTDNLPLSTTELAQIMKAAPLNCQNALNLDGGSSSQLRAKINSFQLEVHGFSNVSDAVIVKAR
ncbi:MULTISPECIES: phosphodiester glycosidase family protein [unclassified Legionella]|uniref:phosphodiester glycosidase family protein n=1 Tax=unclassified Legionella TaxID=2622702 RepID=UPI0010557C66|nr:MULTISPECIES: phosphodiester glycosidase family protein [unclassified Legionella]MDI9819161.1 phosphodiester glycosidase family protein [Legionella sp. PL877]